MKFDRLRLLGFKSFVEPTELLITPGLTGVVGPNGCGKSNLVEALRWVMGESSYKNMRASGMDDVIFSGSGNRPARNFAEVTLVIDNKSRKAPAAFNDQDVLEVTRRIEREAGSAYRLNAREARARDVQILFADASTGSRSPALVRQGMIGELISAKPQARRQLLEEAAGISGLHSRRHEAELRLRAAETNLNRLNDLIGQFESQLHGLKRQARQAAQYRKVSADIRKAHALLLHLKWTAINRQAEEDEAALREKTGQVAQCTEDTARSAKARAIIAHRLPELRQQEAEAAAALQRLTLARGTLEQEGLRARRRAEEISKRLNLLRQDRAREENMARDIVQTLSALTEEEQSLRAEQDTAGNQAAESQEKLTSVQQKLSETEEHFAEKINMFADIKAIHKQSSKTVEEKTKQCDKLSRRLLEINSEHGRLAEKLNGDRKIKRLIDAATAAREAVKKSEHDSKRAEERAQIARARESGLREPLRHAEREAQRLSTEVETLNKVLNLNGKTNWKSLVDEVRVSRGFEAAIGAIFGDDLDAPADDKAPMHWQLVSGRGDDLPLPAGVKSVAEKVEAPAVLQRRLAQTGLVDRLQGKSLQHQLKPGQRLVSKDGDLWRWDGYTAMAEAPTAAARRLVQRNRLDDLELEAKAATAAAEVARSEYELAVADAKSATQHERSRRQSWHSAQAVLTEAQERLTNLEKTLQADNARLAALEEAKARVESELAEATRGKSDAERELIGLENISQLEQHVAKARHEVEQARTTYSDAKSAHDRIIHSQQMQQARLAAISKERETWNKRRENGASQMIELKRREGEATQELSRLKGVPEELETKQRRLFGKINESEQTHRAAADKVVVAEKELAEADKMSRGVEAALADARESRARIESRLESTKNRRSEIQDAIKDQMDVPAGQLLAVAGLTPDDALPDIVSTETMIDKLGKERERIGAVNLRAEEEMGEVAVQLATMTNEREDLETAIRKLRHAIGQLNREGRERLLAAFETVNGHFQTLFQTLFGGGKAELQLTESDDPLQAGLEILVTPPGKKPQTLSLLSGGEQALTALSLIFAVFLTNPAPICVLDEVDAPLDDANVERFCNLVDEMTRTTETRFLIITHHPLTMSRMNRLYGVTMSERGVSQLVSVDLATAETFREAG